MLGDLTGTVSVDGPGVDMAKRTVSILLRVTLVGVDDGFTSGSMVVASSVLDGSVVAVAVVSSSVVMKSLSVSVDRMTSVVDSVLDDDKGASVDDEEKSSTGSTSILLLIGSSITTTGGCSSALQLAYPAGFKRWKAVPLEQYPRVM